MEHKTHTWFPYRILIASQRIEWTHMSAPHNKYRALNKETFFTYVLFHINLQKFIGNILHSHRWFEGWCDVLWARRFYDPTLQYLSKPQTRIGDNVKLYLPRMTNSSSSSHTGHDAVWYSLHSLVHRIFLHFVLVRSVFCLLFVKRRSQQRTVKRLMAIIRE